MPGGPATTRNTCGEEQAVAFQRRKQSLYPAKSGSIASSTTTSGSPVGHTLRAATKDRQMGPSLDQPFGVR
jgi:hypothetical protein